MTPYENMMAHVSRTGALSSAAGILSWDQETMMPREGAAHRAEHMGALSAVIHERNVDPRLGEWLEAIDASALDPVEAANVRRARRDHERATRVPARLAEEIARKTSLAQGVWAEARAADDGKGRFEDFRPVLKEIVSLRREEAGHLLDGGADLYDALLDDYEPGMKTGDLVAMFDALRPRLVALRERIAGASRDVPRLAGEFETERQMAVARAIAETMRYDFSRGRLDLSVHPFSSGAGPLDVRITTRTVARDPFNCLYSTAHEVGHALYEQGLPADLAMQPAGGYVSMGVHESQSRLWENQVGRSRAFAEWLHPRMKAFAAYDLAGADDLFRAANRVETGFIRTEADEVHYNLHVALRFALERRLIDGSLAAADLEEAWNERFEADFGIAVDHASNGVLQDVHWSVGLFGYFPTYTLGNVFSAELWGAMTNAIGDQSSAVAEGETGAILEWLRENVHRHGAILPPMDLMRQAIGHEPKPGPLLDYLESKFAAIYGLSA